MSYPIFPSITRAPKYKSTRSLEDGTISDKMESGYVATRPRFTRQRRTFGATYENICAEDVRVLDEFEVVTVQGKAGAFYYPNILPNWSFEVPAIPGSGQVASGWETSFDGGRQYFAPTLSSVASDGIASLLLQSLAAPVPVGGLSIAQLGGVASPSFPVTVGDVYQFGAQVQQVNTLPTGITLWFGAVLQVTYADATTSSVPYTMQLTAAGWVDVVVSLVIPAAASGSPAVSAYAQIGAWLQNSTAAVVTVPAAAASVFVDQVGLALTTPAQPYGRMPGSAPLGTLVRLNKMLSIKDNAFAGGQPTYDCTLEVTEV